MTKSIIVATLTVLVATAQITDLVEFRSASRGEYRYADWGHSFSNKLSTDLYYVGTPGANEFVGCLGYSLPSFKGLSITPYGCGSKTKEAGLGAKTQIVAIWNRGNWQADAFWAHSWNVTGKQPGYDVVDAANLTRSLGKRWEIGASAGYFHQGAGEPWNALTGPLVRFKDRRGTWAVSYRAGSTQEIRFIRTINFGKR